MIMVRTNRIWMFFVATVLIGSVVIIFFHERFLDVNYYFDGLDHDSSAIEPLFDFLSLNKTPKPDDESGDRPWMIVHVGPPKTGTTTIQHGLQQIALRLAHDDNIYFIGCVLPDIVRVGGTERTNRTAASRDRNEQNRSAVTMFRVKDFLWPGEPLQEFQDVLRDHRRNKHNVLVSSEILSSEFSNNPRYWKRLFRNLFLSSRIGGGNDDRESEEPFFGFNIKVVVTYRHFFEWLPSYWAEQHRYLSRIGPPSTSQHKTTAGTINSNDTKILYPYDGYVPGIIEYIEWFLHNITQQHKDPNAKHTSYSKRFPNPTRGNEREALPTSHGSIWAYLQWSLKLELHDRVDVFDMHQQPLNPDDEARERHIHGKRNLLADFVCQMLPTATKTCRYLMDETSDDDFRKRINESPRQIVSNQDMYRIKQMAEKQGRKIKNAPSALQVPAPIVTRWFRKQAKTNSTESLKRCLGNETLERLKIVSRNFLLQQTLLVRQRNSGHLRSNLSALFRSSTPTTPTTSHLLLSSRQEQLNDVSDDSWIGPVGEEHDRSFAEHVARGVFCEIDVDRLFENKSFIQYVLV